jgi:hypothetical protein
MATPKLAKTEFCTRLQHTSLGLFGTFSGIPSTAVFAYPYNDSDITAWDWAAVNLTTVVKAFPAALHRFPPSQANRRKRFGQG